VAAAMIDLLGHYVKVIALKATPTGSKTQTSAASPPAGRRLKPAGGGSVFRWAEVDQFSDAVDKTVLKCPAPLDGDRMASLDALQRSTG
jgi:hypothetical protein